MNIVELLDLLANSTGDMWMNISDELLEAGYVWELVCSRSGNEVFWLKDVFGSGYFA